MRGAPRLYLITDRHLSDLPLPERVAQALSCAELDTRAVAVQLREKDLSGRELFELGAAVLKICRARGVPLLINERVDVAMALGAEGVHLGGEAMAAADARALLGSQALIGISAHSPEELRARAPDADFATFGPTFFTESKARYGAPVGTARLREALELGLPLLALGGVTPERAANLAEMGFEGVACIGAVFGAAEPAAAVRAMLGAFSPYGAHCATQRALGRMRALRPFTPSSSRGRICSGERELINFASNDYLGLSKHPALLERARHYAEQYGVGATSSRLICGNLELYDRLEETIAREKGTEAALILGSGFQANASALAALLDRTILGAEPRVYCDRLIHASLHMGICAAHVRERRYRHNDLDHLESLLERDEGAPGKSFIVTESVFSMDGDRSDLAGLISLAERYGAFLYLDEAHATGVLGPRGFGQSTHFPGRVALSMGTFSKALGAHGAYVACSRELRDYLRQRCAGLIYTTAMPPPVLGAIEAALELLPTLDSERRELLERAEGLRVRLRAVGFDCGDSSTQIIPAIVGSERRALALSRALEREGLFVPAIRPPTIPEGMCRLRISLTAEHSTEDGERLLEALNNSVDQLSRGEAET